MQSVRHLSNRARGLEPGVVNDPDYGSGGGGDGEQEVSR